MMSERSEQISKLNKNAASRASYIRAKLNVLIPAQLRALRLRRSLKQSELALETGMKQSRISATECPGAVNFNMETLIRLATAHKVGLIVKFVSFSEMLRWENQFSQDAFNVVKIDNDLEFAEGPIRQKFAIPDIRTRQSIEGAIMVGSRSIGDFTTTALYLGTCSNDVIAVGSPSYHTESAVLASAD